MAIRTPIALPRMHRRDPRDLGPAEAQEAAALLDEPRRVDFMGRPVRVVDVGRRHGHLSALVERDGQAQHWVPVGTLYAVRGGQ
jgi:hypothetical protein